MKDVARQQRVSRATVRNLVKRFNGEGIDGLRDKPRSGRPRKLDWEQLRGALLQSPQNFGYPVQGCNRDLLLDYIKRTYGVSYRPPHIYWIVRRVGFRSLVPRPHSYAADGGGSWRVEKNVGIPLAESSCGMWVEDEATVNLETRLKEGFCSPGEPPLW